MQVPFRQVLGCAHSGSIGAGPQTVPVGAIPGEHWPVAGLQVVRHAVHAPHLESPTQAPCAQWSLMVQRLPSSHGVPSVAPLHAVTIVVLVVTIVVFVVFVVVGVAPVVVDVVPPDPATTATRPSAQVSTRPCTASEGLVLWQSFGLFASSFAKHPLAGSAPPLNFATALSTQLFVFGSVGFPGVCASFRHLRSPARYFDAHFFLPAPHFV